MGWLLPGSWVARPWLPAVRLVDGVGGADVLVGGVGDVVPVGVEAAEVGAPCLAELVDALVLAVGGVAVVAGFAVGDALRRTRPAAEGDADEVAHLELAGREAG